MTGKFHLSRVSVNKKTGPIAVTTSPESTCADSCPFKGQGCYAENGPLSWHWDKVSTGRRGEPFAQHCREISSLPLGSKLRLNQAGDLPGNGKSLDTDRVFDLFKAAQGKMAWTYTHYLDEMSRNYLRTFKDVVTVNLSCRNPAEADSFAISGEPLPLTCLTHNKDKLSYTPEGRKVVRCPAEYNDDINCHNCGNGKPLCWRKDREFIVGFTPQGMRKKNVLEVIK